MAAASAYAALRSLITVLDRVQNPTCPVSFDSSQIQSLMEKLSFLVDFMENCSYQRSNKMDDLERRITTVVYAAEDAVESYLVINGDLGRLQLPFIVTYEYEIFSDLQEAIHEMDRIIKDVMEVLEEKKSSHGAKNKRKLDDLQETGRIMSMRNRIVNYEEYAYAALRSLITVLHRVQNPTCPVSFDSSHIQSLMEKLSFLVNFLDNCSYQRRKKMDDLERRIATVVYAAEDMVKSCLVNVVLGIPEYEIFSYPDLQKSIQEMDHIIKDVKEVLEEKNSHGAKNKRKLDDLQETGRIISMSNRIVNNEEYAGARKESPSPTPIFVPAEKRIVDDDIPIRRGLFSPSSATRAMVGADEQLDYLTDLIRMHQDSLKIIPVVGMGGIGKSTLALNVYTRPCIMNRFDRRAWVTVSQQYTVKTLICALLRDIGVSDIDNIPEEELGDRLYKGLFGRKYLIIVDDIWGREAWDEIRRFLPDDNNGSRVLFTTRHLRVARDVGNCDAYEMKLLDDGTSWNLLSATIFGKETVTDCELEKVGKEIATCCKGLPLAIVVIGGLLKRSPKTPESWASIGKDVRSVWSEEQDGYCLDILSFSYNYLPVHLKPCFLYMATFEEDREIGISNLIKLWVADGFLRPINNVTLEEAALGYVHELIDRNLLMVKIRSEIGKVSSCIVHDLIREFCMEEVRKEKFICHAPDEMRSERRLVHHKYGHALILSPSMPLARSIIAESKGNLEFPNIDCKLLRVLSSGWLFGGDLHFVNLRYVRCEVKRMGSNSLCWISLLPYLETLIVDDWSGDSEEEQILPSQIWELQYLRHLEFPEFRNVILPDPESCYQSSCILENLQTLWGIKNFNCTDEVLNRVPNLKALRVWYGYDYVLDQAKFSCSFYNLARLDKLETLKFKFQWYSDDQCVFREPENLMFARNLRELSIYGFSRIRWDNMRIISSLPRLEMLTLNRGVFCGKEWEISEGEFECLKHLEIDTCELSIWTVDSSALPRLQSLKLVGVELEEVPLAIVELASIESIEWEIERLYTVIELKKILEHAQEEQGNDGDLVIKVTYSSFFGKGFEEVKKKLATDSFQITCDYMYIVNERDLEELLGTDQCKELMDRFDKTFDEWVKDEMEEESESESRRKKYVKQKEYMDEVNNKVADAIKQRLAMEF